jgi:hypothetical protein
MSLPVTKSETTTAIEQAISVVEADKSVQGHICINNTKLFDTSVNNGVYGFPGDEHTTEDNLKVTAWRAISSLYNIGPKDFVFLYRTAVPTAPYKKSISVPGAQEFHGIFQAKQKNGFPWIFIHFRDSKYLPLREGTQVMPYRFLFNSFTKNPISIPNDLRNQKYNKNNNLEIIKALSETDPEKDCLWGFRHPAVMNIGAARKSSIVDISNKQLKFLLRLIKEKGIERSVVTKPLITTPYDEENMPKDAIMLNDQYLSDWFAKHVGRDERQVTLEAELYAYFIAALKNPKSIFHEKIVQELSNVNPNLHIDELRQNIILGMLPTLHIQEEIDILLCDSAERNFLIFEMKSGQIAPEDIEQAEKYIQLLKQRFWKAEKIQANIVGTPNAALKSTENVKLASYAIEQASGFAGITIKKNNT